MLLVTGGNGFIATSLRRSLTKADVPFKLAARQTSLDMIAVGNIASTTDWSGALSGVTTVIHLAGLAHRLSGPASLEEFRSVNVDGSINLARQAADAGVRRFVFVSSIGVLGQVTPVGQPLTDNSPARPITPYAVSKHEAEEALKTLCPTLGLELVILRPPLGLWCSSTWQFRQACSPRAKWLSAATVIGEEPSEHGLGWRPFARAHRLRHQRGSSEPDIRRCR